MRLGQATLNGVKWCVAKALESPVDVIGEVDLFLGTERAITWCASSYLIETTTLPFARPAST